MVGKKQLLLNERLKVCYPKLAAILECMVTEQWEMIYFGARRDGKALNTTLYFLSAESGKYIMPLTDEKVPLDAKKIIMSNYASLLKESGEIFRAFAETVKKNPYTMIFSLSKNGEFKTDFSYKSDYPKKVDPKLFEPLFKHYTGIGIESGSSEWIVLSNYLNSKFYKKIKNRIVITEGKSNVKTK